MFNRIRYYYEWLNLIKINGTISKISFFTNLGWGILLLKDVFQKKTTCLGFFGPYYHFPAFFWNKKNAPWNSASIGPIESPWTPIFDHFVQLWIISVPNQPPLKLKSELAIIHNYLKHIEKNNTNCARHVCPWCIFFFQPTSLTHVEFYLILERQIFLDSAQQPLCDWVHFFRGCGDI